MNAYRTFIKLVITSLYTGCILLASLSSYAGDNEPYQTPLFTSKAVPPLTMLVLGRDHSLYFEAYNDASDLDGDGQLDLQFKPSTEYYGLFESNFCYNHSGGANNSDLFTPSSTTTADNSYRCTNSWSGNWLNYITTSRIDALRKVLYGGYREVDSDTETILRRAYIPQDGHSWAKEYTSVSVNGYNISDYTPLALPTTGRRHFFGNLTMGGTDCATLSNCSSKPPLLSVVLNSTARVWDWASSEVPVLNDSTHKGTRTNYTVRIKACSSGYTANCKPYSNGNYKPIGLLHDYGTNNSMKFGLLTGSYDANMSGGILRKVISDFSEEFNGNTGIFSSSATIVNSINNLRIRDHNNGNTGNFYRGRSFRTGIMAEGAYVDWGNPIGEMMYETLRYFAGKKAPTGIFKKSSTPYDTAVGLSAAAWNDPYDSSLPENYKCAKPNMLVMSNVNVSYDSDQLPGSSFGSLSSDLSGLDVSAQANAITALEPDAKGLKFIGAVGTNEDFAPTAKNVNSLANIRGLSPEEPTKQGSFYSASIARFGSTTDLSNATGDQKTDTYVVALASPLPRLEFNVAGKIISLVPFAKTIDGASTNRAKGQYQPTDALVDIYIEEYSTTGAKFRVNFEADEQGNDFDSDVIVQYVITVNNDNTLTVKVTPTAESTGSNQNLGYVISGTSRDGAYLVVQDKLESLGYFLNVPPGKNADNCNLSNVNIPTTTECQQLPWINGTGTINGQSAAVSTQIFTPSSSPAATTLKNPLWYAAKHGIADRNVSLIHGDPDNYFLVTNALTLKAQLNKAFNSIVQSNNPITAPAVQPVNPATDDGSFYVYKTSYSTQNWSGNLNKESSNTVTGAKSTVWSTGASLSETPRKVKMAAAGGSLIDVNWDNLSGLSYQQIDLQTALNIDPQTNTADTLGETRLDFILGEANSDFRDRDSVVLGDIINSTPALVEGAQYVRYIADKVEPNASQPYSEWAAQISDNPDTEIKEGRRAQIYVGSNDGMLHAFDAETGEEKFAFIPTAVIPNLNKLTSSDYNEVGGEHQFYVDGSPIVRDVYINDEWRTVLIGTLRAGGRSIFALDITDPDSISLLWEFSEGDDLKPSRLWDTSDEIAEDAKSDIGYSFPIPAIARLHAGLGTGSEVNEGRWAVVTGNGYDSASGRAVLFVIDIATGKFKAIPTTANATDMLNGLSSVKIADEDRDGVADYAYAGDLKGQLWRFNLLKTGTTGSLADDEVKISFSDLKVSFDGTSPSVSSISPVPLFTAVDSSNKPQAITAAPSLINHPTGLGYIVMFGTGRYFQLPDKNDITSPQTLYGIWDQHTGSAENSSTTTTSLSRSNLVQQSITEQTITSFADGAQNTTQNIRIVSNNGVTWKTEETPSGKYGWYLDLGLSTAGSFTADGERVIDEMSLRGQVLFLTTRTPHNDTCAAGLNGWTYGIDPYTGGRTRFNVFDLNHDKYVNFKDAYTVNGETFVVSGFQTAAGGFSLGGETLFSSDGSATKANYGPNSTGRQTWQALPEDE